MEIFKTKNFQEKYLRYFFALIILYRFGIIIFTEKYYFGGQLYKFIDIFLLLLIIWIIWGRILIIGYILLNFTMIKFDELHGTSTLGTSVACMTSFSLLSNYLLIRNRKSKFFIINQLEHITIKLVKSITCPRQLHIFAFMVYAASSFCAQFHHIQDAYWLEGKTLQEILTSSYLCRFHQPFLFIESNWPDLIHILSIIGVIGQTIFQFTIPFFVFSKFIRLYCIIWGWVFIINCLIFIQLSYLPLLEVILWLSLFHGYSGLSISNNPIIKLRNKFIQFKTSSTIFIFFLIYFIFSYCPFPKIGNISNYFSNIIPVIFTEQQYKYIGFEVPNVFNKFDLKMSDHWMTLHKFSKSKYSDVNASYLKNINLNESNSLELVPITLLSGKKGFLQQSDLLYFGNTLKYRRMLNGKSLKLEHINNPVVMDFIKARILFDYRFNNYSKCVYIGSLHKRDSSNKSIHHEIMRIVFMIDNNDEIIVMHLD